MVQSDAVVHSAQFALQAVQAVVPKNPSIQPVQFAAATGQVAQFAATHLVHVPPNGLVSTLPVNVWPSAHVTHLSALVFKQRAQVPSQSATLVHVTVPDLPGTELS